MLLTDLPSIDVETLRSRLYGDVYGPGDTGWNEARRAWNLAVDQRPAAVAEPLTDSDVVEVVNFAREEGLRVAPQGTGHGAAAIASLENTILLSTRRMRGVRIDPKARRARVRAGALWEDVTAPASVYGLAPLAGSSPDVGVVGYTLGGGLSWLGRKYGFACDSVLSIELVTADGFLRKVSTDSDPELFRALCGGGGNFGVVTAIEFKLYPVEQLTAGAMAWPWERAIEILTAWREWTALLPDEVTSLCRLLQVPNLPTVPPPLRGRQFVMIEAAILGDDALLAPLRALEPEIDLFATMPPAGLIELHNDPKEPVPGLTDHRLLADVDDATIAAIVGAVGPGSDSPLVSVELRHLGGALPIPAAYSLFAVGVPTDAGTAMTIDTALARLMAATLQYDAGRALLNFTDRPTQSGRFFDGYTLHQLRAVRNRVDAGELIAANHAID
ncbi:FAD-binding oxidoreductase [Solirubrobacter soli]|uniref:FAD-binding oxidoreductase n=1 Tax=Solirubrobacter soli TaxID=363832 RepID=UPI0003F67538|nr:FAD-binding oxidoreductase [Solirubrobacter soli]